MDRNFFRQAFRRHLFFDGAMGTMLQQNGLQPGELPETWNITHAPVITDLHQQYLQAGCDVISANTFGANALKFGDSGALSLERIVFAAIENAKTAVQQAALPGKTPFIALDIGPLGKLLQPFGDLAFEQAVALFAKTIRLGARAGADFVLIETMNDALETKAAVLAARENCDLPVVASNTYDKNGKLMTGADAAAMVALLEGLRIDALGVNCGDGPQALLPTVRQMSALASVPVLACPNAGLPATRDGQLVYDLGPAAFAKQMAQIAQAGAVLLGGCCGTTPAYLAQTIGLLGGQMPAPILKKPHTRISSYTHAVDFGGAPVLIGERINPTGRAKFKAALKKGDMDYLLDEGLAQQDSGAQALDVNVGLPGIDEKKMLRDAVFALEGVTDLPLCLDSSNPQALEAAMRLYSGKPLVNSVNGKQSSMDAVLPLVQKYGGVVIALTLDENGIPKTARGRVQIARRIIAEAKKYGIDPKDILVDPLAMAISADPDAAAVTLETLRILRDEVGVRTSLGVSNVSFGLPGREMLGAAFFALAMENGLSAAIMNPGALEFQKIYHSFLALHHLDPQCAGYIGFVQTMPAAPSGKAAVKPSAAPSRAEEKSPLTDAIMRGLKDQAFAQARRLLETTPPLSVIETHIIPALNEVGKGFEKKTLFLPQLLMSAEAASGAFDAVKAAMHGEPAAKKCPFVLATVQGDIHDIGKNIVRVLLENYGFTVIDLGRDVPPQAVADAVAAHQAPLAGLSALMTTTVPAMAETIQQIRLKAPDCRIVVGGAVLTQETADAIGADHYAKDAMETVRYAQTVWEGLQ